MSVLLDTSLKLPLFVKGKVRDTYRLGDKLLIVATDRISAFDVILPNGIPDKGIVLNQLSAFWFARTYHIIHNHMIESVESLRALTRYSPNHKPLPELILGRSMVVTRTERIPVECVVRGYVAGSAWDEYRKSGTINGQKAPQGLKESEALPEPLFTPTTKADSGHDIPLTSRELNNLVGSEIAAELREKSIALYEFARQYADGRGIIIADTKFEFGYDNNEIILIDEALTPDSSRFWDKSRYVVGKSQPSYDKQPVRDWLISAGWNRQPPAPALPPKVVSATAKRYREAYYLLTGRRLLNVFS